MRYVGIECIQLSRERQVRLINRNRASENQVEMNAEKEQSSAENYLESHAKLQQMHLAVKEAKLRRDDSVRRRINADFDLGELKANVQTLQATIEAIKKQ